MNDKKLNIKEMAKIAGVSVATISRAMHPDTRERVAPATLKEIDALIKRYRYTPSLAAKFLRRSSTKTIGVVFPYVRNIFYSSYYTHILAGVANSLMNTGYQFKILLLREESKKEYYDFRSGEGVDGLILTQWFRFFSKEFMLNTMNVPCSVINDYEKGIKAKFFCGDHYAGGEMAAEHFYSLGHRHIGVISGSSWSRDSIQRVKGFRDRLDQFGYALDSNLILQGDYDIDEKTRKRVDELLEKDPKLTAIFCCNDNIAFMVIEHLKTRGLSCPEDISVVGYDDDFRAALYSPALTTIHMPVYELASEAVGALIDHLRERDADNPASFDGRKLVQVHLVQRSSVRKTE